MMKIASLNTISKIFIIVTVAALIVASVFLITQIGVGQDILSEAVEGGQLTLTSVGRSYESLTQFAQNNEVQAKQLLEAARVALENGEAKLNSAKHTSDEYVLGMLDNYQRVSQASEVMAQGVDNLLVINDNLTETFYSYSQKDYENASLQASYCLQILTPLQSRFETSNATLSGVNARYIPSGQRDQLTLRIGQYGKEMEIYNQYILLLRSLFEGKDYLKINTWLEEYLKQLQSAVANGDYSTAQSLLQSISETMQSLRDSKYQRAADIASQLDPSLFNGTSSVIAQELRDKLRSSAGIDSFENYLKSLQKYLEALSLEQSNPYGAELAINEGLGILGQGEASDSQLQGLYEGLRTAFNMLQLRIKNPPPPG